MALRLRPLRHRRRLGRRPRGADRGRARRARRARRGIPLRRHLRDPRLRAEEADGLCLAASRDAFEDAAGFGWTRRRAPRFDWRALHRRQGRRDRPAGGGLPRAAAPGGRRALRRARRRWSTRTGCGWPTGAELSRQAHPDRHRRRGRCGRTFPGAELGLTSDDMFELDGASRGRLLIVGGGYIACEFAGIMNGLGTA